MPVDFGGSQIPEPVAPAMGPTHEVRLPHLSTPPFFLQYHPLRWHFTEGEWLPLLGTMRLEPGVGAVDKLGDTSTAMVEAMKRGWTVLPWDAVQPGTPGGRYIRGYPCAGPRGALYHCTIWEHPRTLAGRVAQSHIDTEGYNAWLRWLVADGRVAPMSAEALEYHMERQGQRVASVVSRSELQPTLSHLAERKVNETARLEEMREAGAKPARKRKPAEATP